MVQRRTLRLGLTLGVVAAVLSGAATAEAATGPRARTGEQAAATPEEVVPPEAADALARERGLSKAEATKRLGQQKGKGDRAKRTEQSLGGRSGGSYLDDDGEPVVTTLDDQGDARARRDGVRVRRVDDSAERLDGIVQHLDREARNGGAGSVQGWYVDVPGNTVVVTATTGREDLRAAAVLGVAKKYGTSVRIEHRSAEEAPQATEWLVGGFSYSTTPTSGCSVGFNAVDAWNRHVMVTAGHCVSSNVASRNGYQIGSLRSKNFPNDDFATYWNSYPSYWQPSPSVYLYNNTYARVYGVWEAPPIGTYVCKSGYKTGYTCGRIQAVNQAINMDGRYPVYGLVRHDACVEKGDSGGANISNGYAVGITSAAGLTPNLQCRSKAGGRNESYYQPVGEALRANGLRLLV